MSSHQAQASPRLDPMPVVPALATRVGHLLARCHFVTRDLADEVLGPLGIHVKQFTAMVILDTEGPVSQQALSGRIGCGPSTRTMQVRMLPSRT